jgi:hypothetical protein
MFKLTYLRSLNFTYILSVLASALVLLMFLAPEVWACHKGVPHGKETSCVNPNPDPPPSAAETSFAIYGDIISEASPPGSAGRPCIDDDIFTVERGDYRCPVSEYPGLMIHTHFMSGVFAKKARPLCTSLKHQVLKPSQSGFQYGWTDNCRDGACEVEVRLIFEGEQILEQTGGESDLLDVVMHAKINTMGDVEPDSNPFYHFREVDILSVDFDYKLVGSTRSAATCTFYVPMASQVYPQPARLISIPVN